MPVVFSKIHLTVNGNALTFRGEFQLFDVIDLIDRWFNALPGAGDQDRIDRHADTLKAQNDGLAAVLHAHPGITSATKE